MAGQPHPERAGLPSPLSLTAVSVPSLPPDLATMGKVLSVSTPRGPAGFTVSVPLLHRLHLLPWKPGAGDSLYAPRPLTSSIFLALLLSLLPQQQGKRGRMAGSLHGGPGDPCLLAAILSCGLAPQCLG